MIFIEGNNEVPIWEKYNLTIEEAAQYSNIGRDRIRELANDRGCTFSFKVGRKVLIRRKEFEAYIDSIYVI